ncbi:MAG: hypothetical protein LBQ69_03675 [Treponema sp.]|jgi:hypothetical protein|nr:hypothetical protein [Treponema sp.]
MGNEISSIICVADMNITKIVDQCLEDLALPEVFVQRAKQMSLADQQGFLGLRPGTKLAESRAVIYRAFVPSVYEDGVMRRIAEAANLVMGGRGCIFSQHIDFFRGTPLAFDTEKLDRLCGKAKPSQEEHALINCVVSRGMGDHLVQAMLDLGVCVPVVFFGSGVGIRDRLGLLRITIPIEKEILWLIVPRSDAELVEKTLIPRARLDVPGQGFLYKSFVRAPVVNLRVRQGKRLHAATMEQVIAALDEVRGSSNWRRLGSYKQRSGYENKAIKARGLFFIGEEEDAEAFRKTAMENGARGATNNDLEMRCYSSSAGEQGMVSRSRELCDIIVSREVEEKLCDLLMQRGFFGEGSPSVLKSFNVEMPPTVYRR